MLRQVELPLTFILSPWPIALERAMGTPGEGRVRGAWRNTNHDVRYSPNSADVLPPSMSDRGKQQGWGFGMYFGSGLADRRGFLVSVFKLLSEFDEFALERVESLGDGVGDIDMIHRSFGETFAFHLNKARGDPDDG